MKEDANVVYFARFCQLIYSYCCSDKPQVFSDLMEPFKLHKRAFTDLLSVDNKKEVLRPLQIPQSIKQFLVNTITGTYTAIFPDVAPSQPSTTQQPWSTLQPPTSAPVVSTSQSRPKSKTKPTSGTSQKVPVVKSDTSSRPKT